MKIEIEVGEELFCFNSFGHWVAAARLLYRRHSVSSRTTISLDMRGRIISCGGDMQIAKEDDAFPVRVFKKRADENRAPVPETSTSPELMPGVTL